MSIINAASASYADVNTAYGLCSNGDVLSIPSGTATWTSTLEIGKSITVQGAGSSSTVLSGANTQVFMIVRSTTTDLLARITAIGFTRTSIGGSDGVVTLQGSGQGGSYIAQSQLRIDHCAFTKGKRVINVLGYVKGVIDHNTLTDPDIGVAVAGDNNTSWARSITAGTSAALFVEDNTFTYTAARTTEPNEVFYHQEGARTVIRYNTIDCASAGFTQWQPFDSHGNQSYYSGSGDFRAQPLIEFYNNTVTAGTKNIYRWFYIRGGSVIAHDNSFSSSNGSSSTRPFTLTEEEGWQTSFFSPLRTVWPAQDQINNTFLWNNTLNGSSNNTVELPQGSDATFIQSGRDYFLAAPASSGGIETWSGRAGGSTSTPTASDTSTMSYAAGANAYYPYTAYTYPHPLQNGAAPTLSSATVAGAGTSFSLVFSEAIVVGAGGNSGWSVSLSGGAVTLTYSSGAGTSTLVYTTSRTVLSGETGTIGYVQPTNGLENGGGTDVATFAGSTITNNSTQQVVATPVTNQRKRMRCASF